MPVRKTIPYSFGTFFITFTCHKWLSLIDKVKGHDIIYKWFDHLKNNGHYINGYVIMPNHVHVLISFKETEQSINMIVGNGKRFMAYEIIDRLKNSKETELLKLLSNDVELKRKANNKLHEVWQLSFDWKECRSYEFVDQKLKYMHENPCSKKWNLSNSPVEYQHSSAGFYISGEESVYIVTNFSEMNDLVLRKL